MILCFYHVNNCLHIRIDILVAVTYDECQQKPLVYPSVLKMEGLLVALYWEQGAEGNTRIYEEGRNWSLEKLT
jgi:hypothetical protein